MLSYSVQSSDITDEATDSGILNGSLKVKADSCFPGQCSFYHTAYTALIHECYPILM